MTTKIAAALAAMVLATPVSAEFAKVNDRDVFMRIVEGKTLTRPLIRLQVTSEGRITGTGGMADVSGNWTWRDGYFCRDLNWRGRDLGYNCQEVRINETRIRFTSDKGTGDYADFRLR